MALYRHVFKKWYTKYLAKKEHFAAVIARQKQKGSLKEYAHCSKLLESLENDAQTILKMEQEQTLGWFPFTRKARLRSRTMRRFKRYFKELDELTKPMWRQWTESLGFAIILVLVLRNFVFGLYHVPTGSAEHTILVGDRILGNKMAYYFSDIKRGEYIILDDPMFIYEKSNMLKLFWQKYIGFPIPLLGLPTGADSWTKRVIGIPGDTIEGRIENDRPVIYLNGKKLDEPYVNQYPLILVNKTIGFFDCDSFIGSFMPSFLQKKSPPHITKYTYDPSRAPYDQPFYKLTNEEIVRSSISNEPILTQAFTPSRNDVFGPFTLAPGKYWVMGDSRQNSGDSRYWLFLDRSIIQGRVSCIIWSLDSEEMLWAFELIKHPINFWTKSVRWNRFFTIIKHQPGIPVETK